MPGSSLRTCTPPRSTARCRWTEEDAFEFARRAAREEGIFVGASSGASLAAVAQLLPSMPDGARVLTFCYDTGERYLSVDGLFPVPAA